MGLKIGKLAFISFISPDKRRWSWAKAEVSKGFQSEVDLLREARWMEVKYMTLVIILVIKRLDKEYDKSVIWLKRVQSSSRLGESVTVFSLCCLFGDVWIHVRIDNNRINNNKIFLLNCWMFLWLNKMMMSQTSRN